MLYMLISSNYDIIIFVYIINSLFVLLLSKKLYKNDILFVIYDFTRIDIYDYYTGHRWDVMFYGLCVTELYSFITLYSGLEW